MKFYKVQGTDGTAKAVNPSLAVFKLGSTIKSFYENVDDMEKAQEVALARQGKITN